MTKFSITTSGVGCWATADGDIVDTVCRVGVDRSAASASPFGVDDQESAVDRAVADGWIRIGVYPREIDVTAEEPTPQAVDAAINYILDQPLRIAYWLDGSARAMHSPAELCDALRDLVRAPAPEFC